MTNMDSMEYVPWGMNFIQTMYDIKTTSTEYVRPIKYTYDPLI